MIFGGTTGTEVYARSDRYIQQYRRYLFMHVGCGDQSEFGFSNQSSALIKPKMRLRAMLGSFPRQYVSFPVAICFDST